MGDQKDRLIQVPIGEFQHVDDLSGIFPVQIAGGFIRQKKRRTIDQGTGNGHPLLLAAR